MFARITNQIPFTFWIKKLALIGCALLFTSLLFSILKLRTHSVQNVWTSSFNLRFMSDHNSGGIASDGNLYPIPRTIKTTVYEGAVDKTVNISHSDPKTYSGPVVEGWEPLKSRDMRLYVKPEESTVLMDPGDCMGSDWTSNTRVLIMQHSKPTNFDKRLDNRRTWIQFTREIPGVRAIFVVGRNKNVTDPQFQAKLQKEQDLYCDILQVDYVEHYNNNTLKSLHGLKYVLNVDWITNPEFVMKTDDDIYINLPLLTNMLFNSPDYRSNSTSVHRRWPPMIGFIYIAPPRLLIPPDQMKLKYTNYLICPDYMYNKKNYPSFTSGTAYVMPWWTVACLYQEALNLPYYFIEDAFMGGFVADRCLIPQRRLDSFNPGRKEVKDADPKKDMTIHYMDHNYKYEMHKLFTANEIQ